jgi:GNAT superfamily N-acetyltransferase
MVFFNQTDIVVCRPALRKDSDEVMELCSHIWDGDDYIPMVWEDWLADPDGMLGVAEMSGRVVGIFKLTKFKEMEWYMEGLRVHPDVQGRGIAAHIHEYVVETWHRMGSGIIRLTTGSYNIKVHQICERTGFKRIAEFIPYRASCLFEGEHQFEPLKSNEAQRAMDFISGNPLHDLSWRLVNLGWVYADPQPKHIQEAIAEGHAWWWKDGEGFLSIWEDREDDGHAPGIQLVACPLDDLSDLLVDYRRLMGEMRYKSAGWVAPNQSGVLDSLELAGFQRSWDVSLFVFELKYEG